jgi:hypothetical protein
LRDFTQLLWRIKDKIDNHQREIAVAQKQVGGFDGFKCFYATYPEKVAQRSVAGSEGRWIEGIASIDQREKVTIALCALQKRVDK